MTALIGIAWFRESIHMLKLVGIGLIIAGVMLLNWGVLVKSMPPEKK